YLPAFDTPIPKLVKMWDEAPASNPLKAKLTEQIDVLRKWDFRWSVSSVATSLAVYWGDEFARLAGDAAGRGNFATQAERGSPEMFLQALSNASEKLTRDFATWKTPWGEINRYQRNDANIVQVFDDAKPSIPVGFTSSRWGSLASFGARTYP